MFRIFNMHMNVSRLAMDKSGRPRAVCKVFDIFADTFSTYTYIYRGCLFWRHVYLHARAVLDDTAHIRTPYAYFPDFQEDRKSVV